MNAPEPRLAERVLTHDGHFTDDHWTLGSQDDPQHDSLQGQSPPEVRTANALLPLAPWLALPPDTDCGVWLAPTDDPAALAAHLPSLSRIAVQFPRFADGRGYSIAHRLRRLGYRGDLRAVGEVLIDQLYMLKRVGFTSFALRADQDAGDARAALVRYSDAYQGAYDQPLPAYRRGRAVQGAT